MFLSLGILTWELFETLKLMWDIFLNVNYNIYKHEGLSFIEKEIKTNKQLLEEVETYKTRKSEDFCAYIDELW